MPMPPLPELIITVLGAFVPLFSGRSGVMRNYCWPCKNIRVTRGKVGAAGSTVSIYPPQPFDQGLFGNPKHKADRRELDSNQQHLQRHHDFLFRRPQIKEDRVTGLGERPSTVTAFENAPAAALCCVGRNRADISLVHVLIPVTHWIRTRLIPIFRFSQEPSLLPDGFLPKTHSSLGSSIFQSISG
jgi:hypothetical protein